VLQPDRSWYLNELARHLGVTPSSLQRELAGLVEAGILRQERDGNRVRYQPDAACSFLVDLQGLFAKTIGIADVLRETISPVMSGVEVAFIYGSVASRTERPGSDVDLLMIGDIRLADVAERLRDAEGSLGRAVNPILYSPWEYAAQLAAGSHFATALKEVPKIFLKGTDLDLARLSESAQNAST
jgi:DNA-binding transcriptional ArsR family regulator